MELHTVAKASARLLDDIIEVFDMLTLYTRNNPDLDDFEKDMRIGRYQQIKENWHNWTDTLELILYGMEIVDFEALTGKPNKDYPELLHYLPLTNDQEYFIIKHIKELLDIKSNYTTSTEKKGDKKNDKRI